MDEVVKPNFKQHNFGNRFSATNQPAPGPRAEKAKANASVKEALMNAFDKLGNEAFFVQLGRGSAEDRRCLAMILAKLLPIEVAGALDATLTVRVVTMLGDSEIDITRARPVPTEAVPALAYPAGATSGRSPEDGDG